MKTDLKPSGDFFFVQHEKSPPRLIEGLLGNIFCQVMLRREKLPVPSRFNSVSCILKSVERCPTLTTVTLGSCSRRSLYISISRGSSSAEVASSRKI